MLLKFSIVFLACCALVNSAVVIPNPQQATVEHSIDDIFMSFSEAFQSNPEQTTECFDSYVPKMQALTEAYKASVAKCHFEAEEERKGADKDVADKRASISSDVASICSAYSTCNTNDVAINYFQCYSTSGIEGARTSNSISYKANDAIEYINIRYTVIETQLNSCTNAASGEYNLQWSLLSDALEKCIKGEQTTLTPRI